MYDRFRQRDVFMLVDTLALHDIGVSGQICSSNETLYAYCMLLSLCVINNNPINTGVLMNI